MPESRSHRKKHPPQVIPIAQKSKTRKFYDFVAGIIVWVFGKFLKIKKHIEVILALLGIIIGLLAIVPRVNVDTSSDAIESFDTTPPIFTITNNSMCGGPGA